jgi:hypothetical protein
MLTASVETLLGADCDAEAQALHLQRVRQREKLPAQQLGGAEASFAAGQGARASQHRGAEALAGVAAGGSASGGEARTRLALPAGVSSKDDPVLFYERIEQTVNTIM